MNTLNSARPRRFAGAVTRDFGSVQELRRAFLRLAERGGENGCVWLTVSPGGEVKVVLTRDRQVPRGSVLACADLWDGGRVSFRKESVEEKCLRRWRAIDWDDVSARYDALLARVPPYPAP